MQKKENKTEHIRRTLDAAVEFVIKQKEQFVQNPDKDFTRNRKISMKDTINLILSMEGGGLNREIHNYSQKVGAKLTTSAFVQQRSKISSAAFYTLFHLFNMNSCDKKTYRGYHLLAVDGSDINQYRNPNTDTFVRHSQAPKGYNQTHLNALYDLCNKTYLDVELQPKIKANEIQALIEMMKRNHFPADSIIIADRGYESFNLIAHLLSHQIPFLLRIRSGVSAMAEVKKLPMASVDRDVTVEITTTQTKEDKEKGRRFIQTGSKNGKKNSSKTPIRQWDFPSPYTLKFRVVRFLLDSGEYETVATSLPRETFQPEEIKKLYHMRWGIETSFRELKYNIGLINLHCKKEDLVRQELYAALIMYNFCSRIANTVDIVSRVEKKHQYKLNFSMAVYLCRKYYRHQLSGSLLLQELASYLEPIRPGRKDKRNVIAKRFVGFSYRIAA